VNTSNEFHINAELDELVLLVIVIPIDSWDLFDHFIVDFCNKALYEPVNDSISVVEVFLQTAGHLFIHFEHCTMQDIINIEYFLHT
jgi:hypothetical protein